MIEVGSYVVYIAKPKAELGLVKNVDHERNLARVYFHSGETSALTSLSDLLPLRNYYNILKTDLGGDSGAAIRKDEELC